MPETAHVTSLDALESFRSALVVYLSQARPALEEVSADVLRTRLWVEEEQRLHWEHQMRRRAKALEEAQQTLFSARLSPVRHATAADQFAVQRAKQAVAEADLKLKTIKRWARDFDGRVQPLVKQMEKLQTVLAHDMVKAVAYLTEAVKILAAYAEARPPAPPMPNTPPGGATTAAASAESFPEGSAKNP